MSTSQKKVRAYGHKQGDGLVQLSFTLPIPMNEVALEAARQYALKLGLENIQVASMESIGSGASLTFFVVYGSSETTLDMGRIKPETSKTHLSPQEIEGLATEKLQRKISIVGANLSERGQAPWLEAILSLKGVAGDRGLEGYRCFQVMDWRQQPDIPALVARLKKNPPDVLCVGEDPKVKDLTRLLKREKLKLIVILVGPQVTPRLAKSWACQAVFAPGSLPAELATFIVEEVTGAKRGTAPQEETKSLWRWFG